VQVENDQRGPERIDERDEFFRIAGARHRVVQTPRGRRDESHDSGLVIYYEKSVDVVGHATAGPVGKDSMRGQHTACSSYRAAGLVSRCIDRRSFLRIR
jgi:hypothetical protein